MGQIKVRGKMQRVAVMNANRVKARAVRYSTVKSDELVSYASGSSHIPESTLRAWTFAMKEAVAYFVLNGMQKLAMNNGGAYPVAIITGNYPISVKSATSVASVYYMSFGAAGSTTISITSLSTTLIQATINSAHAGDFKVLVDGNDLFSAALVVVTPDDDPTAVGVFYWYHGIIGIPVSSVSRIEKKTFFLLLFHISLGPMFSADHHDPLYLLSAVHDRGGSSNSSQELWWSYKNTFSLAEIMNLWDSMIQQSPHTVKYQPLMKQTIITTLLALVALTVQAQGPLLKTHVETGDLEGVLDGTDLAVYKAIPYAAPPVGELRWKAPQPANPWKGVLKAEDVAKWPPQPEKSYVKYDMMSEDCLYLSVTTPAKTVNEALPVMVFIHGGGFQTEHYGGDLWQSLARKGIVAVSIEYRAGSLGFMAHADLAKESDGHSGNYGLLDQIFALKWVQRNIKNFGGDPSKVTIFGESAGAMSCHILCVSPLAKGLFRACISQSGAFLSPTGVINQELAQTVGQMFMSQLKKNSIAEMRQMDAKELTGNGVNFPACSPIVDGYVIPEPIYDLYQKGNYNDVPVLIMHNSDEGAVEFETVSAEDYNRQFSQLPGQWADSAKAVYPGTTDEERLFSMRDFVRDVGFGWPAYAWATLQKQTGKSPVYVAYLAQKSDTTVYAKGNRRGAAHADDMMYLKGAFDNVAEKYPQEKKVSDLMQQYWVNFAKTMNPDGEGLPHWPEFEDGKPTVMQFNNGASLITAPNQERIKVIDGFMQYVRSLRTSNK